jgi:hypothetical protein
MTIFGAPFRRHRFCPDYFLLWLPWFRRCSSPPIAKKRKKMNAQLMEVMAANLKKQAEKQAEEHVVEAQGDVAAGEKPLVKKKPPPPGAQQIGMHAMLFQEAQQKEIKLKETPKTWGVKLPSNRDMDKK